MISPLELTRLARKVSNQTNHRIARRTFSRMNSKVYTIPENPQYRENVRITESEAKTIHDALQEIMFPKRITRNKKEEIGPECEALANYMRNKIAAAVVSNAKAATKINEVKKFTAWTSDELDDWLAFPLTF